MFKEQNIKLLKNLLIILLFHLPTFLFGQTDSDTIPSDLVFTKRIDGEYVYFRVNDSINQIRGAIIRENSTNCKDLPITILYIKDGKVQETKRYTYYKSCLIKERYYTSKKTLKIGPYTRWNPEGLKVSEGNFNINGNEDGVFTFYNYIKSSTYYVAYNDGHRIFQYTKEDSLDANPKIKNILSFDLFCLLMNDYKLIYERYINEKNILKFELNCKPTYPKQGTLVFNLSKDNPYIYFVPSRYFVSIDNQKLFGYKKYPFYLYRHPYYMTYGIYYLYKSYEKIVFHYIMGDDSYGYNKDYLKSEFTNIIGIRTLLGKKRIFGKSKNKINEVLDCFAGVGICYMSKRTIEYGVSHSLEYSHTIVMHNEPKINVVHTLYPSLFIGLRMGIGWK